MIFLRWLLVVDRLLFKKFKNIEINALKIQYLWQSINKVFIERNFRRFQPLPTWAYFSPFVPEFSNGSYINIWS